MAVVGVLAQARIGDRHDRHIEIPDACERLLHDPVLARGGRSPRVFGLRQAEQDHATNTEIRQASRFLGREVRRHPEHAGHRFDRRPDARPGLDEQRGHQHGRIETGLTDQCPQGRRPSQSTWPEWARGRGV